MNLVEQLNWRYATKKMDASKEVSQKDIDYIKKAIQLSASSYGLQPYTVLEINTPSLREQLQPLCWNQSQVTDASHFLAFCNHVKVTDDDVDAFIKLRAETTNVKVEDIAGYGDFVKGKMKEKSDDVMFHWSAKQCYIALSNALNACAELQIDSTPMEGFETEKVNALLELPEQGLNAAVLLAIGYRHEEDETQHHNKVRKSISTIFESR